MNLFEIEMTITKFINEMQDELGISEFVEFLEELETQSVNRQWEMKGWNE